MIYLEFDPVAQRATITIGGPLASSLDGLYRAHARRIDVQADALDLLLANVQRERLFCARGRLLLLFAWKMAHEMGIPSETAPLSPKPSCRSQDSFCGDTGCEVHGTGPGPAAARSPQPAASSPSGDL